MSKKFFIEPPGTGGKYGVRTNLEAVLADEMEEAKSSFLWPENAQHLEEMEGIFKIKLSPMKLGRKEARPGAYVTLGLKKQKILLILDSSQKEEDHVLEKEYVCKKTYYTSLPTKYKGIYPVFTIRILSEEEIKENKKWEEAEEIGRRTYFNIKWQNISEEKGSPKLAGRVLIEGKETFIITNSSLVGLGQVSSCSLGLPIREKIAGRPVYEARVVIPDIGKNAIAEQTELGQNDREAEVKPEISRTENKTILQFSNEEQAKLADMVSPEWRLSGTTLIKLHLKEQTAEEVEEENQYIDSLPEKMKVKSEKIEKARKEREKVHKARENKPRRGRPVKKKY